MHVLFLSIQGNDDKSEMDNDNGVYVPYCHFQSQCVSLNRNISLKLSSCKTVSKHTHRDFLLNYLWCSQHNLCARTSEKRFDFSTRVESRACCIGFLTRSVKLSHSFTRVFAAEPAVRNGTKVIRSLSNKTCSAWRLQ